MGTQLVIVESPTKAKTLKKFLPKEYRVVASIGHVRDLPQSASAIPQKYKSEPWARLGIDIDNNFAPLFVNIKGKSKIISEIKKELATADSLILATDEDREGESIAWHLIQVLKPKHATQRIVFHEITKEAILKALENKRDINTNLVKAQETRRMLDRIFGYKLTELLWEKITYGISAGRVQSPGLRLIVERERTRHTFKSIGYNDIIGNFNLHGETIQAKLYSWDTKKIAIGADFDNKGALTKNTLHVTNDIATKIIDTIKNTSFRIARIEQKPQKVTPPAPFITSTLQQEANRRLKLTARETMRVAQSLYEQGYITYMRTDSYALSGQAIHAARNYIQKNFSPDFLPEKPNFYGSKKSKGAQEAHEAIRPSGLESTIPAHLPITGREKDMYTLIWQRTIASQMTPAIKTSTTITIEGDDADIPEATFVANGSILTFSGFLELYSFSKVEDKLLPNGLTENLNLGVPELDIESHETKPPSRYNDASLVKQLEALGIGRPSTYASIINTLLERGYVRRVNQSLIPTLMAFSVIQFLEQHFSEYVDYEFTSELEDALDLISVGKLQSLQYLQTFYFGDQEYNGLKKRLDHGKENIQKNESQNIRLPDLDDKYEIKIGRYGPFAIIHNGKDEQENFTIPSDTAPADLHEQYLEHLAEIKKKGPEPLGVDPDTDNNVYLLTGRYGPYVQLGDVTEETPTPRRASVPRNLHTSALSLEMALKLLSVPREIGVHPDNNEPIIASTGRFGPYIKCGTKTRSLKKDDDVYTIGLPRALTLLAEQPRKRTKSSSLIKNLGDYQKKTVQIYKGPYGYYLKLGTKNIRIPEDKKDEDSVEQLKLEQAIEIIKNSK